MLRTDYTRPTPGIYRTLAAIGPEFRLTVHADGCKLVGPEYCAHASHQDIADLIERGHYVYVRPLPEDD